MSSPRVAVIGARRRRQGLGPFVVRELMGHGAEVPCFLATSEATRRAAAHELLESSGCRARGYLDAAEMIAAEEIDALAILSPAETHRQYLELAASAGLHALCEKPLVWGESHLADVAKRIVGTFDARGLALVENCQWPYTLPAFERLHPGSRAHPPTSFEMQLQPASLGRQMLGDCLPHVLSMLQALLPGDAPVVDELHLSTRDPGADRVGIRFRFRTAAAAVAVRVELRVSNALPRDAAYALDGRWARRRVSDGYQIRFHDGARSVPVDDPLGLLVADFLRKLPRRGQNGQKTGAEPGASPSREIAERMQFLATIAEAYQHP